MAGWKAPGATAHATILVLVAHATTLLIKSIAKVDDAIALSERVDNIYRRQRAPSKSRALRPTQRQPQIAKESIGVCHWQCFLARMTRRLLDRLRLRLWLLRRFFYLIGTISLLEVVLAQILQIHVALLRNASSEAAELARRPRFSLLRYALGLVLVIVEVELGLFGCPLNAATPLATVRTSLPRSLPLSGTLMTQRGPASTGA